jgi:hypothetical protein
MRSFKNGCGLDIIFSPARETIQKQVLDHFLFHAQRKQCWLQEKVSTDPASVFEWFPCKKASLNHAAASSAVPSAIHPDAPDGKSPGH